MISVIITTYKEPKTLPKAINSILNQIPKSMGEEMEIIVVGPDRQTKSVVQKFSSHYSFIKYIQDRGEGKPAALNLAFKKSKGDIIVSTDGDVIISSSAIKNLIHPFKDKDVGATSGHPISINERDTILGYWSHFLTNAAHQMRIKRDIWPCSGYLYAFRNIIREIPTNALSEDGLISQMIRNKGYLIKYCPKAKVYVKYPNNFKDWLKQKVRSVGGYWQKFQIQNPCLPAGMAKSETTPKFKILISKIKKMRSFRQEVLDGIKLFFAYPKSIKEFFWTILLYLMRIYLWLTIFWKIRIRKEKFKTIWKRIESTK